MKKVLGISMDKETKELYKGKKALKKLGGKAKVLKTSKNIPGVK